MVKKCNGFWRWTANFLALSSFIVILFSVSSISISLFFRVMVFVNGLLLFVLGAIIFYGVEIEEYNSFRSEKFRAKKLFKDVKNSKKILIALMVFLILLSYFFFFVSVSDIQRKSGIGSNDPTQSFVNVNYRPLVLFDGLNSSQVSRAKIIISKLEPEYLVNTKSITWTSNYSNLFSKGFFRAAGQNINGDITILFHDDYEFINYEVLCHELLHNIVGKDLPLSAEEWFVRDITKSIPCYEF